MAWVVGVPEESGRPEGSGKAGGREFGERIGFRGTGRGDVRIEEGRKEKYNQAFQDP